MLYDIVVLILNKEQMSKFNPLDYPICLSKPLRNVSPSAWVQHAPFAMFLVDLLRPKLFVELGTHSGNSYCAFCQAIKSLNIDAKAYAVDTWEGDIHAGFYGSEILADLRAHHDPLYGNFSRLIQSTFDEAGKHFPDSSIDLLHIDGLHTYEAVKHDFETWLPKLSRQGVVIFHDINVREMDFGVWQLWEELKSKYPSFELMHGHGLGVLAIGPNYPSSLDLLLKSSEDTPLVRDFFHQLGLKLGTDIEIQQLRGQLAERDQTVQALSTQVVEKEQVLQTLTAQVAERDAQVVKRTAQMQALTTQITEKEQELADINQSKAWRLALLFRHIRLVLVPPNSYLSRLMRQFVNIFFSPIKKIRRYLKYRKDLPLIQSSGLFDEAWYLDNNLDVCQAKMDPVLHYLLYGGFEGRDPSPLFKSSFYLTAYPDVKEAGFNPLIHYLQYGQSEGRDVQPEITLQVTHDPILVYTMGKVGTTTMAQSLLDAYKAIGTQVMFRHAHFLNKLDSIVQKALQEMPNPIESLEEIALNRKLREEIEDNPERHWNIVTLVRDPVARNVGILFQALSGFIPDWGERYANGKLGVRELQEWLINTSIINDIPNEWFDVQIKQIPAFGIDVYAEPFPKELGYKIYLSASRARLLLIRMENLNECAERAMYEFLGLENFTLHNANIGEEKDYAELYRTFKRTPLPLEYVRKIYDTKFARHFYTELELEAFIKRWT